MIMKNHHHGLRRTISFPFHKEKTAGGARAGGSVGRIPLPPKGFMAVMVGWEGEPQERIFVPVWYLHQPLFLELLEAAEKEYGFNHKGAIAIPCRIGEFRHVEDLIYSGDVAAANLGATGHGHRHHHRRQAVADDQDAEAWASAAHRQHHGYLPHFTSCFGS